MTWMTENLQTLVSDVHSNHTTPPRNIKIFISVILRSKHFFLDNNDDDINENRLECSHMFMFPSIDS